MMIVGIFTIFAFFTIPAPQGADARPGKVMFDDLVRALADADWMLTPAPEGERLLQFSSWDRASMKGPGDAAGWFANKDYGNYLRIEKRDEKEEMVLVDAEGPAAVVRIWTPTPDNAGNVYFYFDGETSPSLTTTFQEIGAGKAAEFPEPFCEERSKGWNCYIPIPFAKHLKITANVTKKEFWYQINVRKFAPGVVTETFRREFLKRPVLQEAGRALSVDPMDEGFAENYNAMGDTADLEPGESYEQHFHEETIVRMLRMEPREGDVREMLKSLRLRIFYKGSKTAAVDAPLGDFFGTAPDFTKYRTHWMGVRDDGAGYCKLPLPMDADSVFKITNEGREAAEFSIQFTTQDGVALPPLRLHAKYKQSTGVRTRPYSDYNIIEVAGPGRFAGIALSVRNPVSDWWGEGDEKIYIDGEAFPSIFGTGTEDYFGFGWSDPRPFSGTFHSQSRCDGPGTRGFSSMNRYQIGDSIPFAKKLRFDLEIWHWASTELDIATVAYWYAPAAAADNAPAMPPARERIPREMPGSKSKFTDAVEGESFINILKPSAGKVEAQDVTSHGDAWSRGAQLWWTGAKPGAILTIPLEVKEAGEYSIRAQCTKAPDYGIVQFLWDGAAAGRPFDGYESRVAATGDFEIIQLALSAGKHALAIRIEGTNPLAKPAFLFGLDYVRLVRK